MVEKMFRAMDPGLTGVCCIEDGGQGDDGGSGGGGGSDPKTPVTLGDLNKILDQRINGAMKGWGERLTKGLPSANDFTSLRQAVEALKPKEGGDNQSGGNGGDQGRGNQRQSTDESPEVKKLRIELDQLRTENAERAKREKARDEQIARDQEEAAIAKALSPVREELRDAAVAMMVKRGVVSRDENGQIVYKAKREWGTENITVEAGISEWLKTNEGKAYLPPVDVNGTGEKGKGGNGLKPGANGLNMNLAEAINTALLSDE